MYKVRLSRRAQEFLENAWNRDKRLFERLSNIIESLKKNPYVGSKLKGKFKGKLKLRSGPYRIIYEVFEKELLIIVIDIDHRRDVYRILL